MCFICQIFVIYTHDREGAEDEHLLNEDEDNQSQRSNRSPSGEVLDFLNDVADVDTAVVLSRYLNSLRSMECTVEAVLLLMEMEEEVGNMERKMLWASESHIILLKRFNELTSIYDARKTFLERRNVLTAALEDNPSDRQLFSVKNRAKAMVTKQPDYHIIRTTDELMAVYQSICRIEATTVQIRINEVGMLTFPSTVVLPTLTALRIKYISGELSGKLPEKLKLLWIDGPMRVSRTAPMAVPGLSSLEILVVNSCSTLKLLCPYVAHISAKCDTILRTAKNLELPSKVVIVPAAKYCGRAISENATVQKNVFFNRLGLVFYKNATALRKFARCTLPADIASFCSDRKRIRLDEAADATF
uniref:LRR domain containing protein n=1 Tax=Strongyloides papillosus TaxID=174720 RepID=A0A0N5CA47_STREA